MNRADFELATDYIRAAKNAERLAGSTDSYVRQLVAQNPFVHVRIIERLLFDPCDEVAVAAAFNWRISLDLQIAILQERGLLHLLLPLPQVATCAPVRKRQFSQPIQEGPGDTDPSILVIPEYSVDNVEALEYVVSDQRPRIDAIAMHAAVHVELHREHYPYPMPHNNRGYDIRSASPEGDQFIEVKGVGPAADTIVVSRSQIELAKKVGQAFTLALVVTDGSSALEVYYLSNPYTERKLEGVAAVVFDVAYLKSKGKLVYARDRVSDAARRSAQQTHLF